MLRAAAAAGLVGSGALAAAAWHRAARAGVRQVAVPPRSLLGREASSSPLAEAGGCYADAFCVRVAAPSATAAPGALFARAFFGSPVFRVERALLAALGFRGPTDAELSSMAFDAPGRDRVAAFTLAASTVAADGSSELLFRWAVHGRTWLAVRVLEGNAELELLFGSALLDVPSRGRGGASRALALGWAAVQPAHALFSRLLLAEAAAQYTCTLTRPHGGGEGPGARLERHR